MNLGSDEGYSLQDVAQTVIDNFSKRISLETSRNEFSNTKTNFVPNLDLAKEVYHLKLTIDFKEAIRKTIGKLSPSTPSIYEILKDGIHSALSIN